MVSDFKQNDERWANDTYYNGYKFKDFFCFGTSLGNLVNITPPEAAQRLRDAGAFNSEGMLNSEKAAQALGLEYNGKSQNKPDYDTIGETTYFAPKAPQHFFIVKKDGSILDPLGKNINYPIKSYRLFKTNEGETMPWSDNEVRGMFEAVRHDLLGQNPNENDLNADMGAAKERQKEPEDWALSEFIHDRFKEVPPIPPKDCSVEINEAIVKTRKEDQEVMNEKLKGLIDPKDCPATEVAPENDATKCNWWCKLWGCCK